MRTRQREASAVKEKFPDITALPCDVGDARQRKKLATEVLRRFPDLTFWSTTRGYKDIST